MECPLNEVDTNETKYIKEYNSTDDKYGYNIALGGGGRSIVNTDEETRLKISSKQQKNHIMNIKPYSKNNIIVGYIVDRKEKGVRRTKYFTKTSNTPEENYVMAKEFLEAIKNSSITDENINKYNRGNDLPKNISAVYKDLKIIGYKVFVMKNKKMHARTFQSLNKPLEELFEKAIEYKNSILNSDVKTIITN